MLVTVIRFQFSATGKIHGGKSFHPPQGKLRFQHFWIFFENASKC